MTLEPNTIKISLLEVIFAASIMITHRTTSTAGEEVEVEVGAGFMEGEVISMEMLPPLEIRQ